MTTHPRDEWYAEREITWTRLLIYLRTSRSINQDDRALERLAQDFPYDIADLPDKRGYRSPVLQHPDWLSFGDDEVTWADGLVLSIPSYKPAQDVALRLAGALGLFKSWAILGRGSDCVENTGAGPLSTFTERETVGSIASLYLMADDDDGQHEQRAETLRSRLGERCKCVFRFGDGHVLLFPATEPLSITAQRHLPLLEQFGFWALCDADHQPQRCGSAGEAKWQPSYLPELRFGED